MFINVGAMFCCTTSMVDLCQCERNVLEQLVLDRGSGVVVKVVVIVRHGLAVSAGSVSNVALKVLVSLSRVNLFLALACELLLGQLVVAAVKAEEEVDERLLCGTCNDGVLVEQ